ncbi:MAG: hypothetical protein M1833_000795 [Piccolia ochrophora]|nr:MAG: hypothetical protein M1833_000795 [Piccolia ochrophora]
MSPREAHCSTSPTKTESQPGRDLLGVGAWSKDSDTQRVEKKAYRKAPRASVLLQRYLKQDHGDDPFTTLRQSDPALDEQSIKDAAKESN